MTELKFSVDTRSRKQWFTGISFSHPAKMSLPLQLWLIENYTKPGEVILDPMAGSGTLMVCCSLGRHCLLVELEQKFCDMMAKNWEKVKQRGSQMGYEMGRCQIIQGDARNLEGLLVDKCIFSPPFAGAQQYSSTYDKAFWDIQAKRGVYPDCPSMKGAGAFRDSPENISNLPYGQVSKIITSPPYAEQATQGGDAKGVAREDARLCTSYSDNPDNLGNLKYGDIDAVITSPPYEEALGKKHHSPRADKLAEEKKNPVTYTDRVDSIITSPPYEGSIIEGNENFEGMRHLGTINKDNINKKRAELRKYQFEKGKTSYSPEAGNIGNLKSQSYLEAMLAVYLSCYTVLKPQGLLLLVVKNFIRDQKEVDLRGDTVKLCEQAGFTFKEEHHRILTSVSFWRIIYQQRYPSAPKINKEYVLVFQKNEKV